MSVNIHMGGVHIHGSTPIHGAGWVARRSICQDVDWPRPWRCFYPLIDHWWKQNKTTGWWFGTWILFSHILGKSSSQTDFHIFQKGLFHHQPETSSGVPLWFWYTAEAVCSTYVSLIRSEADGVWCSTFTGNLVAFFPSQVGLSCKCCPPECPLVSLELEDTSAMTGNGSVKGKSMFKSIRSGVPH